MSGESLPITPSAFAEAIKELPLSAVYAKASEIQNSISHLHRSNDELRSFITDACETEQDKRELEGYIVENEDVIAAMTERTRLLKAEVENRGQIWIEEGNRAEGLNGTLEGEQAATPVFNGTGASGTAEGGGAAHPATGTAEESRDTNEEREADGVFL